MPRAQLCARNGDRVGKQPRTRPATASSSSRVFQPGDQDDELVPAVTRDGIPAAHRPGEHPCDVHQDLVSGRVAERVVHLLEVVEVAEPRPGRAPRWSRGSTS